MCVVVGGGGVGCVTRGEVVKEKQELDAEDEEAVA